MSRHSADQQALAHAAEQFKAETAEHLMTVLMDQSPEQPYRHVRFARPGTGIWSFSLVTWPGHLSISGDLESFTFRRLRDMFDFFRGGYVNPGYWAEKLVAGRAEARFSPERFADNVWAEIEHHKRSASNPNGYHDAEFEALTQAVQVELLDDPPAYVEQAHEMLAEFRWDPARRRGVSGHSGPAPVRPEDVDPGDHSLVSMSPIAIDTHKPKCEFVDTWEWDLRGYDHHFLLACHAIHYGVNRYLAEHPHHLIKEVA